MKLSNKVYDILKWITIVALPALGTLYFTLSGIWGLPYGEQVVGTITALITFLGVLLGISTHSYNKENVTQMFNEDLLKDMLGFNEQLHIQGEKESEAESEE